MSIFRMNPPPKPLGIPSSFDIQSALNIIAFHKKKQKPSNALLMPAPIGVDCIFIFKSGKPYYGVKRTQKGWQQSKAFPKPFNSTFIDLVWGTHTDFGFVAEGLVIYSIQAGMYVIFDALSSQELLMERGFTGVLQIPNLTVKQIGVRHEFLSWHSSFGALIKPAQIREFASDIIDMLPFAIKGWHCYPKEFQASPLSRILLPVTL